MSGFMNEVPTIDLKKYENEYFELLGKNFENKSIEYAKIFANYLSPDNENL